MRIYMTRLHHNRNWKIEVFGREHGLPHFHGYSDLMVENFTALIHKGAVFT